MWNHTGKNQFVAGDEYSDAVSLGLVEGVRHVIVVGRNTDIDINTTPEDIWSQGGVMTYSTTADIDIISSSSGADNQTILITGQTLDGVEVQQTAVLDGQNKVTLSTPLWRVYQPVINRSDTDLAGDVYVYVDSAITLGVPDDATKIRAKIGIGSNQALMLHYTIPANEQGMFIQGISCLAGGTNALINIELFTRTFGGVFISGGSSSLDSSGTGCLPVQILAKQILPPRTDIVTRVTSTNINNVGISSQNEFRLYKV